jgi:hypothetical protein
MSVWQQQKLDDLRRAVAALLEHRALTTDIDAIRRLDGDIAEHCTAIADIERKLKATP